MNTDKTNKTINRQPTSDQADELTNESIDPLNRLVDVMKSVDTDSPEAKENETSMSDGQGGRIKFTEDLAKNPKTKVIRGVEAVKNSIKGVEDSD